ncbi:MAG: putative Ig domain-containing protein [bacterium]|nr:hypothetical protein [bacterium]MBU1916702.1 hypothetical protein [bacterium]
MLNRLWLPLLSIYLISLLASCGANLHKANLTIGLLEEPYSFFLSAEDESYQLFDSSELLFSHSGGELPNGIVIGSSGEIAGTPTELGDFDFRVTAYAIDDDWGDWYFDNSGDDITSDHEWYTLFITEQSSNENCPLPSNENTTGIYVCAGTLYFDSLHQGDKAVLDISYFIDFDEANNYGISSLTFTILYDTDFFYLDSNTLTSSILREAANIADATVDFDTTTEGSITIEVSSVDKEFNRSGRMLDLSFYASQDIEESSHNITITIDQVKTTNEDIELPDFYAVDGSLIIENEE